MKMNIRTHQLWYRRVLIIAVVIGQLYFALSFFIEMSKAASSINTLKRTVTEYNNDSEHIQVKASKARYFTDHVIENANQIEALLDNSRRIYIYASITNIAVLFAAFLLLKYKNQG